MAKDAKKKKADKKARVAQKQEKKATQKEKKVGKKPKDDDSDAEDADLDAILAEYQKQQEQFLKVTEITADPPSPRSSATLVASPANSSELFLFGGEYYNGALASFFSDLYVYKINSVWSTSTMPAILSRSDTILGLMAQSHKSKLASAPIWTCHVPGWQRRWHLSLWWRVYVYRWGKSF